MKNVNIGIVNLVVTNKLKDSYFNNEQINESKELTSEFLSIIKTSPVLQLEFKVFTNLESKYIDNELSATRYIDNNIKLFEVYTIEEIDAERAKLTKFINENSIPINDDKVNLFQAINNLINESLKNYNDVDVDNVHESFTVILNHIKIPKKKLVENIENNLINEQVVEIAIEKFNEKYSSLDESDVTLIQKLIKSNDSEKKKVLDEYKEESLTLLNETNKDNIKDNIEKAIKKIKEMVYNKNTVNNDIIGLHSLKKGLL